MRGAVVLSLALCMTAFGATAETVVAAHVIRPQQILGPTDMELVAGDTPGALTDPAAAFGLEARVTLYPGRPIRASDLGPAAIVDRNQIVKLNYFRGGLAIATEGRVLDRAGVGESIRVMNLQSRTTITGVVLSDGSVTVAPASN